jgi:hypothetical protein
MSKPATIDFATAQTQAPVPVQTQALRDLVAGEARDSLLAIHEVLHRELPQGPLAIYDAGAAVLNAVRPRGTDVRRSDHHVILRKR